MDASAALIAITIASALALWRCWRALQQCHTDRDVSRALLEDSEVDQQRLVDLFRTVQRRIDQLEHEELYYRHQVQEAAQQRLQQRSLRTEAAELDSNDGSDYESPRAKLERRILENYELYWQYDQDLQLSSDPKEQQRLRAGRDEAETRLRLFLRKYGDMVNGDAPKDIVNIRLMILGE